jgi:antitoxin (DNA-binding transcriptional repressor) of toxin-antitoxin stability system
MRVLHLPNLTVTSTELARNTREILDRIVSDGQAVAIERNHTTIAQLTPPERHMTVRQALSLLSSAPKMSAAQGQNWLQQSKEAFGNEVNKPWE